MAKKSEPKTPPGKPRPAYELNTANEEMFAWGGRLGDLRRVREGGPGEEEFSPGAWVSHVDYGPLGACIEWYEPIVFEEMCDADSGVQGALSQCRRRKYSETSLQQLQAAITTVFEEQYLPHVIKTFDEHAPLIAQYFAAKAAWKQVHPEDFKDD